MQPLFITATGTGVGKTYATVLLLNELSKMGLKVAPFKPIETGVEHLPVDGILLQKSAENRSVALELETVCPINYSLPAAPDIARDGKDIDWDLIDSKYEMCQKASDIVLIEGAGGAFTPIENDFFNIDLAKRFNAKTLLICHDKLGMIHDLITTLKAIRSSGIEPIWAINARSESFDEISKPYLQKRFNEVLSIQSDLESITKMLIS